MTHALSDLSSLMTQNIEAALFDLDGTLVDSEDCTVATIQHVMAELGFPDVFLPPTHTRGRSWSFIARELQQRYPITCDLSMLEKQMEIFWSRAVEKGTGPVTGAVQALRTAASLLPVTIVSSSPTYLVIKLMKIVGLADAIPHHLLVGAEQLTTTKPDPEGYLTAASRLGVNPAHCIVFEDSSSGLGAARAAGMIPIAVLEFCVERTTCQKIADYAIEHYQSLPHDFWTSISTPRRNAL